MKRAFELVNSQNREQNASKREDTNAILLSVIEDAKFSRMILLVDLPVEATKL